MKSLIVCVLLIMLNATAANAAVCTGSGMTVTVTGDKIVSYSYGGKSYSVARLASGLYRIGQAGQLSVSALGGKSFKGTFSLRGQLTPATFTCR